jgi:hypothetical protein
MMRTPSDIPGRAPVIVIVTPRPRAVRIHDE